MLIGYARVSSVDQNEERQIRELMECGVESKNVYLDKQSGKNFVRPAYVQMLQNVKKGDLIIVKSIDRLGRNYQQIQNEWRKITKDMGVDLRVLDMPLLDTTISKDLLGTFIADLVLQLLPFVSENERVAIKQRQAEGIKLALERGTRFGRPPMEIPEKYMEYYIKWKNNEITAKEGAEICNMPVWAFYRAGKKDEEKKTAKRKIKVKMETKLETEEKEKKDAKNKVKLKNKEKIF